MDRSRKRLNLHLGMPGMQVFICRPILFSLLNLYGLWSQYGQTLALALLQMLHLLEHALLYGLRMMTEQRYCGIQR